MTDSDVKEKWTFLILTTTDCLLCGTTSLPGSPIENPTSLTKRVISDHLSSSHRGSLVFLTYFVVCDEMVLSRQ